MRDVLIRALDTLPPFSASLNQLLAILLRPNVQLHEVGSCVERDALLSAYMLRIVNSAAYALRVQVTSVTHACSILGIQRIRNLALALSVSQHWRRFRVPKWWSQKRFNEHSLATAILADRLAVELQVIHTESAFVAGLLHDVGKLLIVVTHPQAAEATAVIAARGQASAIEMEQEVFGIDHAELSALALDKWKVDAAVQAAARFHHDPDKFPGVWRERGLPSLAHVLAEADAFVNRAGMGVLPPLDPPTWETYPSLKGLTNPEAVIAAFQKDLDALRQAL